jgi:ELWxxDGT repeat protein
MTIGAKRRATAGFIQWVMKIPPYLAIVAVLAAFLGFALWFAPRQESINRVADLPPSESFSGATPSGESTDRPEGLPLAPASASALEEGQSRAWRHLEKLLAKKQGIPLDEIYDAEDFRISAAGGQGDFTAENPGQEFGVNFRADGVIALDSRRSAKWNWSMRTLRSDEAGWEPVSATRMQRSLAAGITEWYINEARGLEQGYTIASAETDPGRIEVSFASDLHAELVSDDRGSRRIAFRDAEGREVLTYHGLVVNDAKGRILPSRMELAPKSGDETLVALHYDTRDAAYPVKVDPWVSTELALFPGNGGSYPQELTEFQGKMFFRAYDGSSGSELWKSDGTAAGTVLVKDIDPGCESSYPEYLTVVGDNLFFRGRTREHGDELWVSDGTAAGTRMVADLAPGFDDYANPRSSYPHYLVNFEGSLFFTAQNSSGAHQLWKSDGTEAGTVLLTTEVAGGPESPQNLIVAGETLFFSARSPGLGYELWKCDDPGSVPELVMDIAPGSTDSSPEGLTAIGDLLYFSAGDRYAYNWDDRNRELWKSDGTEAGTVQVTDIAPGSRTSDPYGMTEFEGEIYFRARSSGHDYELWKVDDMGSSFLVKDIHPGSNASYPWNFTVVGDSLFFSANDGASGYELWATDGTTDGTKRVADIAPESESSSPEYLTPFNGYLYFSANDGEMNNGRELWRSDGTESGTTMVADLWPGFRESGYAQSSYPQDITRFGGKLLLNARNSKGGELWISDGTGPGTMLVKDINLSPFYSGQGSEPERSVVLENGGDYEDTLIVPSGNLAYFSADDGIHGWELWASDGTAAGTRLVRDIAAGASSSYPRELTDLAGLLVFSADDRVAGGSDRAQPEEVTAAGYGRELWRSDGTATGTFLVTDLWPGEGSSDPQYLTVSGGAVFFSADVRANEPASANESEETEVEGNYGRELWKTDGTGAGTVLVKDIDPYSDSSYPSDLVDADGTLFFRARDHSDNYELWKSDGTGAGTVLVKDIQPGSSGSYPYYITPVSGRVFFSAYTDSRGHELWRSDGTEDGTYLVADIDPGSYGSYPQSLTMWNGTLYFSAETRQSAPVSAPENAADYFPGTGRELWKSDGTPQGTVLVKDIHPGEELHSGYPLSSYPYDLTVAAGQLFFVANDGVHGEELWKTDGTESGTVLVRDILPGIGRSCVRYLKEYQGKLVFSANNGVSGSEAWISDGTSAGTMLAEDLIAGLGGSSPIGFTVFKGELLYWAGTERGTSLRSTGSPVVYRPDLLLRKSGRRWIGADLYRQRAVGGSVAGQTLGSRIESGGRGIFHLRVENDGNQTDQIRTLATGLHSSRLRVACFELDGGKASPVTAAMLGGGYVRAYPAGGFRIVRLEFTNLSRRPGPPVFIQGLITAVSSGDPGQRDIGATRLSLASPASAPRPPRSTRRP